jgi:hypothetical protein
VVRIDLHGGPHGSFEAPEPLLDLELLPAARPEDGVEIVAAGLERLHRMSLDGGPLAAALPHAVVDLAAVGSGAALRLAALAADGRLSWLDRAGRAVDEPMAVPAGQRLVAPGAASAGVGLAPAAWAASAALTRARDGRPWVWLAGPGQVVAFDLATGLPLARLEWPDVGPLAAGDLDGDGADEIAVASAARVTLLRVGDRVP